MSDPETHPVKLTVISVERVDASRIFALATVEIEIEGIVIVVQGIQAVRCDPAGTKIELPKYRDHRGVWRNAVSLPEGLKAPLGDAVLEALLEHGLAKQRFEVGVQ